MTLLLSKTLPKLIPEIIKVQGRGPLKIEEQTVFIEKYMKNGDQLNICAKVVET